MPHDKLMDLAARLAHDDRPEDRPQLQRSGGRDMAGMLFAMDWQCERAQHTDIRLLPELNLWRDKLPSALEADLVGQPLGHQASQRFSAGELLPAYDAGLCFAIAADRFNRRRSKHRIVEPRAGRFYPRGYIAGVRGILPEEHGPFRVGDVRVDQLTVDLNHPLAGRDLQLSARIFDSWPSGDAHDGQCNDIAETLASNGPGMAARWHEQPTDFWADAPFSRLAEEPDERFYSVPRMVQHLDGHCRAALRELHRELLPVDGRVLDLMASWHSHLTDDLQLASVTGLGMNAEELANNPRLSDWLLHDLNREPSLPFEDASFDAVICSASVEYLVRPHEVFAELRRILRPGGLVLTSFSDRWFPPKAINIWHDLHPFERPGLVLEYFQQSDFSGLHTLSLRGLPRPVDDKYANQRADADPLFAVWGYTPA
jgi:SAM-dependent methyltransferase